MPICAVCGGCGQELPADSAHFDADKRRWGGLSSRCKDCRRVVQRVYARRRREAGKPLGHRPGIVRALLSAACGRFIAAHTSPFAHELGRVHGGEWAVRG